MRGKSLVRIGGLEPGDETIVQRVSRNSAYISSKIRWRGFGDDGVKARTRQRIREAVLAYEKDLTILLERPGTRVEASSFKSFALESDRLILGLQKLIQVGSPASRQVAPDLRHQ